MASAMQQLAMGDHHAASRGIEIDTGRQFAHWSPTAHCVGQEPVASWEHQSAAVRLSDRCDRRKDIHRLRGFGVGPYALVLVKCLRPAIPVVDWKLLMLSFMYFRINVSFPMSSLIDCFSWCYLLASLMSSWKYLA